MTLGSRMRPLFWLVPILLPAACVQPASAPTKTAKPSPAASAWGMARSLGDSP